MTRSKSLIKGFTQPSATGSSPWQLAFTLACRGAIGICVVVCSLQLYAYVQAYGWSALPSVGQYGIVLFFALLSGLVDGFSLGCGLALPFSPP